MLSALPPPAPGLDLCILLSFFRHVYQHSYLHISFYSNNTALTLATLNSNLIHIKRFSVLAEITSILFR